MSKLQQVPVLQEINTIIKEKGIEYNEDNGRNYIFKVCPFCGDDHYHFYLGIAQDNLGLWNCFKCSGGTGSDTKIWGTLKEKLVGSDSYIITAPMHQPLNDKNVYIPKVLQYHTNLMSDSETLDYLVTTRNINVDTIKFYKLGLTVMQPPNWEEPTKFLCIPHFYKHALMNAKFRSLPPAKKGFTRIPNGASVLFNYDNIDVTKNYIYICEGELDAISLVQAGESNVVSITVGAKSFNPEWFDLLNVFKVIYIVMDNDRVGQEGAHELARRLGLEKCYNVLLPKRHNTSSDTIKDINDFFKFYDFNDFKSCSLKATKFVVNTLYTIDSVLTVLEDRLLNTGNIIEGLDTPWPKLNAKLGPIAKGDLMYLSGRPKCGKCLTKDAYLTTNFGLLTLDELFKLCNKSLITETETFYNVYDAKLNVNTQHQVYPISHLTCNGMQPIKKIVTKLGLELKVTHNHPILTLTHLNNKKEIQWVKAANLNVGDSVLVDTCNNLQGVNNCTQEDARVLGYLYGSGEITNSGNIKFIHTKKDILCDFKLVIEKVFSHPIILESDIDTKHHMYQIIDNECLTVLSSKYGISLTRPNEWKNEIPYFIRTKGEQSVKEFIKTYFECCAILYCSLQRCYMIVHTPSKQFATQLQLLLLNFGILSTYNRNGLRPYLCVDSENIYKYISKIGFISKFNSSIAGTLNSNECLTHNTTYHDTIVSISDEMPEFTYDIVQPTTHEFTANGIINHNTTLALNLCHYYAYEKNIPSLLFCLEMMPERLATKLICYHRKVNFENLTIDDLQMTRADFNHKNAPFYLGYTADPKYLNPDAIFNIFELVHRKYGIEFFVFDNLQFLSRSITNTAHEISKISRQFKLMAMNLNCQVATVVQPKRMADDQVMTSSHLKDSSAMEADADHILINHRKNYAEVLVNSVGVSDKEMLSPIVVVTIDRSRYGPGGATSLYLDGAKSLLREATEEELLNN